MQLGHESSNSLKPTVDQQFINGMQLHARRGKTKDPRLMKLDFMIHGQSKVVCNLKKSILRAADCSSTVLITGESVTGKELITANTQFFVTRDQKLLDLSARIYEAFGITILRPTDLIIRIDELRREVEYAPQ